MAYETGTATDIDDLINVRLKNFALSNGWTVNSDSWPTHLALSKGGCFANLRWDQSVTSSSTISQNGIQTPTDGFGVPRVDHKVWGFLATEYTGGGGWTGQVGAPVNSTSTAEPFCAVNDLAGPFPSYHLFSDDGTGPSYIYLVVETRPAHYSHLFFGEVDGAGMNYSPRAAFLTGLRYAWWPNSSTESQRDDFAATDSLHYWPFSSDSRAGHYQVAGGAAMPTSDVRPTTANNRPAAPVFQFEIASPLKDPDPTYFSSVNTATGGDYMSALAYRGAMGVSGVQPLNPIPCIVSSDADEEVLHYLGQIPDIRLVNMIGLTDGQEVTVGPTTWLVFPVRKFQPWCGTIGAVIAGSPEITNSSFHLGFAIKRVD